MQAGRIVGIGEQLHFPSLWAGEGASKDGPETFIAESLISLCQMISNPASRQRVAYALDQVVTATVRGHDLSWLHGLLIPEDHELFREQIFHQGMSLDQIQDALAHI